MDARAQTQSRWCRTESCLDQSPSANEHKRASVNNAALNRLQKRALPPASKERFQRNFRQSWNSHAREAQLNLASSSRKSSAVRYGSSANAKSSFGSFAWPVRRLRFGSAESRRQKMWQPAQV
ncbi:hypothetical protein AAFF_G00416200 [Aldrovandia affinis]|uniref:Uncharacterized protein n=1 Tax=Aldrovandia affinis TaxID=143900 RepID=A0AAD7WJC6_9TELE|nr:hypothetical protein AAFF_G00416200 [Aldrovandia affinis]